MFAIFTRLTRDEGAPRTESLDPKRGLTGAVRLTGTVRTIIVVPLILGLMALFGFMAVSSATHGCRPEAGIHGTAGTVSCQSAQEPLERP